MPRSTACVFKPDLPRVVGQDSLDGGLGGREPRPRSPETFDPFLEQPQRLVEVEILRFQAPEDLLQALQLGRKARGLAHRSVTRAPTSPSVTRKRNASPGASCSTRRRTCPSASRATA